MVTKHAGSLSNESTMSRATQSRLAALSASCIPMVSLREKNRKFMRDVLDGAVGRKVIIFDRALVGPLGTLVEASELKQWGVDSWFELDDHGIDTSEFCDKAHNSTSQSRSARTGWAAEEASKPGAHEPNTASSGLTLIYFVRPKTTTARRVARQIRAETQSSRHHIVAFVPRPTEEVMAHFSQHLGSEHDGMYSSGHLQIYPCPIYLFPLDSDLLSLELNGVLRDFHSSSDPSGLITCSEALAQLQTVLEGLFPRLWVVGNAGKFVCDQLLRIRRELQMQLPLADMLRGSTVRDGALGACPVASSETFSAGTSSANLSKWITPSASVEIPPIPPLHLYAPLHDTDDVDAPSGELGFQDRTTSDDGPTFPYTPSPYDRLHEFIDDVILFDRRADLVTPFCTPFTYEALLDLIVGINQTLISTSGRPSKGFQYSKESSSSPSLVPQSREEAGPSPTLRPAEKSRTALLSSDAIFAEIRNLPQSHVGALLHGKASEVQKTYKEKESLTSIAEINDFMKRFKVKQMEHVSISLHVNLLTTISDVLKSDEFRAFLKLEDDIMSSVTASASVMAEILGNLEDSADNEPTPHQTYRLLCLLSNVNNGLKPKWLDTMTRTLCQMFGIQELLRLRHMEKAGLITVQTTSPVKSTWKEIKTTLNLLVEDSGGSGAKSGALRRLEDIAYVCSGYAPLSVRLVEQLYRRPGGWRSLARVFDLLWGPTLEARQTLLDQPSQNYGYSANGSCVPPSHELTESQDRSDVTDPSVSPVTVVFFIGGCTYAEIAALRHLSQSNSIHKRRRFLIITTELLNYVKLIDSLGDDG